MKYLFYLLITVFTLQACNQKNNAPKEITTDLISNPITASGKQGLSKLPQAHFNKTEHDFGILLQGEKVSYTFIVKNIGGSDLILKDAKASCGCTVPKISKAPIAPGKEGEVEVIFNSSGRSGRQVKNLTIWTNCQPNSYKLRIVSEIVVPNK